MTPYQALKMIHILGLILLFFGFGGVLITNLAGNTLAGKAKAMALASHGLGLITLIVSGFFLFFELKLDGMPGWLHLKLTVWLLLGAGLVLARRKPSVITLLILLSLAMLAAFAAIFKPF